MPKKAPHKKAPKAAKAEPAKRKRAPRQTEFKADGMGRKTHPDVEKHAEKFAQRKDERRACDCKKNLDEAAAELVGAMQRAGLDTYELEGGGKVVLEGKVKVKLQKPKKERKRVQGKLAEVLT